MTQVDQNPRLLIVDDDQDSREGYAEYLAYLGFEVEQAATGVEALDCAMRTVPQLILLDLAMPEMDGCQVLEHLRSDPRTCGVPVIVLSACVFPSDRERAEEAGCNLFIPKPCSPDSVFKEITRLIG